MFYNGLKLNINLIGIHCAGNEFEPDMDVNIFPKPNESEQNKMSKSFYSKKIIGGNFDNLEILMAKIKDLEYEIITPSNLKKCWICEKWIP